METVFIAHFLWSAFNVNQILFTLCDVDSVCFLYRHSLRQRTPPHLSHTRYIRCFRRFRFLQHICRQSESDRKTLMLLWLVMKTSASRSLSSHRQHSVTMWSQWEAAEVSTGRGLGLRRLTWRSYDYRDARRKEIHHTL